MEQKEDVLQGRGEVEALPDVQEAIPDEDRQDENVSPDIIAELRFEFLQNISTMALLAAGGAITLLRTIFAEMADNEAAFIAVSSMTKDFPVRKRTAIACHIWVIGALVGLLLIINGCTSPASQEKGPSSESPTPDTAATYTNAQYGFSLSFPKDTFAVAEPAGGEELPPEARSYIPACLPEAAACVYYAGDAFENTNFGGAGVSVSMAADTAACGERARQKYPVDSARTVTIDGVPFTALQTGEAGMSHRAKETWYWTVHDGRCLTLVARISYSVYEVYEPGSIEKFSEDDRARLREQLKRIARSFSSR